MNSCKRCCTLPFMGMLLLGMLMLLLLADSAAAQANRGFPESSDRDDIVPGQFFTDPPTLENLGFRWYVDGDANRNAAVEVAYRVNGDATWLDAQPMLRVRHEVVESGYRTANMFGGSVMFLEPGTEYEVRFTMTDPDGGAPAEPTIVTVATRSQVEAWAGGQTISVQPGESIMDAYDAAAAGDVIMLEAGTHAATEAPYQLTKSGEAGKPIVFRGAGADQTILEGPNLVTDLFCLDDVHDIVFEDLTLRTGSCAIHTSPSHLNNMDSWFVDDPGFAGPGASDITIRRCRIENVVNGIWTSSKNSCNWTITDNVITGANNIWYPFTEACELAASFVGVSLYGRGHAVGYNRITWFMSLLCTANAGDPADHTDLEVFPVNIDFYNNELFYGAGDTLRTDYTAHNVRVYRNMCSNARCGISIQPSYGGPIYVIRNEIYGITEHYFKWNNEPAGIVALHNTNDSSFYTTPHSNTHLRNNLFIGGGTCSSTFTPELHTMDYDGFGGNLFHWSNDGGDKTTYVGLAAFNAATGYEANGIMIGRDDFVNAPEHVAGTTITPDDFDLRLADGSGAIDSAVLLANINDDYNGAEPDRGAIEFGDTRPHYGPRGDMAGCILMVQSTPAPGVSITGTHPGVTTYTPLVSEGTPVSLTAPAMAAGRPFVQWADGAGGTLTASQTLSFDMTGNTVVVAEYGASLIPDVLYVNDDAVGEAGSVCTVGGDDANDGFTPDTPMRNIQALLDTYPDIGTGKTVWVDPGVYVENIVISSNHSGLTLQGAGPGMTVLDGNQADTCLILSSFDGLVSGFTVRNGSEYNGAGVYLSSCSPTFSDCAFENNTASELGGGIYCHNGCNPTVTNCTFTSNSARCGGGMLVFYGSASITNCAFSDNTASSTSGGGGAILNHFSPTVMTNCTFTGNTSGWGGAIYNEGSSPTVTNCTFTGNSAPHDGGGICNDNSTLTATNSILWSNTAASGAQIGCVSDGATGLNTITVSYSNVQGGQAGVFVNDGIDTLNWGTGNMNADPLFVDAANDDYHLQATSPCIDSADGASAPASDMDGNPRVDVAGMPNVGNGPPWADIGAYESQEGGTTWTLTINVSPAEGGTTTPAPGTHTYANGTVVDLTATANAGCAFDHWDGDVADPNAASTTVTMDADKTVTAVFGQEYTLTVESSPSAGVSITGTHPGVTTYTAAVAEGTPVALTAPAMAEGRQFARWADQAGETLTTSQTLSLSFEGEGAVPSQLYAGTAKVDISPEIAVISAGGESFCLPDEIPPDPEPPDNILNPLYARVVVLKNNDISMAIISVDGILFSSKYVIDQVKSQYDLDHVTFSVTHSHSGMIARGLADQWWSFAPDDPGVSVDWPGLSEDPWYAATEAKMITAVGEAVSNLFPARIASGQSPFESYYITHNRRHVNPDGSVTMWWDNPDRLPTEPLDPQIRLIRLDDMAGNPRAVMVHYACHPVCLMGSPWVSPDFPGAMCDYIEDQLGPDCMPLFLQGASGDIDPYEISLHTQYGIDYVEAAGADLGAGALSLSDTLAGTGVSQVAMQVKENIVDVAYRDGTDTSQANIMTVVINDDLAMATIPGEIFIQHQLNFAERSPFEKTMLLGLAYSGKGSPYMIYIPTAQAVTEGGYGATQCSYVEPNAGENMVNAALAAIRPFASDTTVVAEYADSVIPDVLYVNDDAVGEAGSVCTVAGDDANDGLTPDTPMRNIQALLDAYPDIGTDKTVWADPGTYVENVTIGASHSGLTLQGAGQDVTILDGNQAGSCLALSSFADGLISGLTISNGNATNGGGMYSTNSSPTITNCTFSGNTTGWYGGGMYNSNSSPTLTDCTFTNNSGADLGGAIYSGGGSSLTVTRCTFDNNSGRTAAAVMNHYGTHTFTDCLFSGNTGSPVDGGGGAMSNNNATTDVINCVFIDNSTGWGGAMHNEFSAVTLTNCTLSGNSASNEGGGIGVDASAVTLTNCILWDNTALAGAQIGVPEDWSSGVNTVTVSYSNVQGGQAGVFVNDGIDTLNWGTGNTDTDPLFVDAGNEDYHLQGTSPCIDSADGASAPASDMDGNPRYDVAAMPNVGNGPPWADMGAYESQEGVTTWTLTIDVNPTEGGTTTPAPGAHIYAEDTVVNLTATANPGYAFDHWDGDVADPNATATTVTIDADKTVTAIFVQGWTLTINVTPTAGGTTTPAAGTHTYDDGTVVDLTATANAGYRFDRWEGDVADPNAAATTVTMDADKTVTAVFVKQWTLTVAVTPTEGGTTTPAVGTHAYDDGEVVTITATANPGYRFDHWEGDFDDADAADYFVNKQGNDANDGRTRETAFLTIQRGVDALEPGDTVDIGPGEYFENVKRTDLGGPDADTVIRAEVPGTVVLRGDVPAPEFTQVDGYRFVYAAPFAQEPRAVLDHNKLHTFFPKGNVPELEFDPGFFHYDAAAGMLYISNPDLSAPDQGRYTVAVETDHGLELTRPQRVTIDGLAGAGFDWAILLITPESCVARNCVMYMNVGGLMMQAPDGVGGAEGGSDNLAENCVAYGNTFAGITRYSADNDVIRDNYLYKNVRENNEHFGVIHYGTMFGPFLMQNNMSWGHNFNFSVKPGNQQERLENSVGLGFIRISNNSVSHNLIGGGNEYDRGADAPADSILFVREGSLDEDFEFADPDNLDFRLQPDSRFIGTAPDSSDRGPYQYEANIYYVSPTGNDQADGLSMRAPWQTLAHAFSALQPGDTVYLSEGQYAAAPLNGVGDGETPVRILGRSRGTVVISGLQNVIGGAGLVFERMDFDGGVSLNGTSDATFKNCTFFGASDGLNATSVDGLKVTHSLFDDASLTATGSSDVMLSGNVYANAGGPAVCLDTAGAIRYSDYNGYQDTTNCWEVNNTTWSFADVQQQHQDLYSRAVTPNLTLEEGVPRMESDPALKSVGPNDTALGIHHEYEVAAKTLDLVGPFVHSVSDTTANIEWWTSHPATCDLAWGETAACENQVYSFSGSGRYSTYSLTGLTPGQTYYFKIVSADAQDADPTLDVLYPTDPPVSFTTDAAPAAARTFYVAPDGDDANDGLSRGNALRTICRAADQVGPGDTVLLATGDYPETVRIRTAGTSTRPITFRCITGEKPTLQLAYLPRSFELIMKPDIHFDGLYFEGQDMWREGFVLRNSPRVQITRCMDTMVTANSSPDLLVKNCVIAGGWSAVGIGSSPGSIIENNVIVGTILRDVSASSTVTVRKNVFCDCIRNKMHQTLTEMSGDVTESDNCFYTQRPETDKLAVSNLELPIYKHQTGSNSVAANPMMPDGLGWLQGWSRVSSNEFDECWTANPDLILRDIGLQQTAFADFVFDPPAWPYTVAWATDFVADRDDAEAYEAAEQWTDALAAYNDMLATHEMCDRLKSEILKRASLCAERLSDYEQAMDLAEAIPLEPLAMHRQMQVMLEQEQYAELVAAFSQTALGGRDFLRSYIYPEHEDVAADLYYYRAIAYTQTGNLVSAEADLKAMNDKRELLSYTSGVSIHDEVSLRLGDFYRYELLDDDLALAEYLEVCERTTWEPFGTVDKGVLSGAYESLELATTAACEILRAQGRDAEADYWEASLAQAQADAAAALGN